MPFGGRRRHHLYVFAAILLTSVAFADRPLPPHGKKSVRDKVVEELFKNGYFKNADCTEIASYVLKWNGLPGVGVSGAPARGQRQDLDRRFENSDPPRFVDSVLLSERPRQFFRVSADGDSNGWTLTWEREVDVTDKKVTQRLQTKTAYSFRVIAKDNRASCELNRFQFDATTNGGGTSVFSKTMDLDACLDLFLPAPIPASATWTPLQGAANKYLRQDCSVGMHYSYDAKSGKQTRHPLTGR